MSALGPVPPPATRWHALRAVLAFGALLSALAGPVPVALAADRETERAERAYRLAEQALEPYSIRAGDAARTPLTRVPAPVLRFANPIQGSTFGAVYVWTAAGRPEVITSVVKNYRPSRHMGIEFNSLSLGRPAAERDGGEVWHPARPGLELKPVPGAPAPADSAPARVRQMRTLAGQFSASETNEANVTRDLRLLTRPIYRYESPGAGVLDGGLFVFSQATDPEAFLILEARPGAGGAPEWRYAFSRASYMAVTATHRGVKVWSAPLIDWAPSDSKLRDPGEPFVEFLFRPGQGVNPASDEG